MTPEDLIRMQEESKGEAKFDDSLCPEDLLRIEEEKNQREEAS